MSKWRNFVTDGRARAAVGMSKWAVFLAALFLCSCPALADAIWEGNALSGESLYQQITRDFDWIALDGGMLVTEAAHLNGAFAVEGNLDLSGVNNKVDHYGIPSYVSGTVSDKSRLGTVYESGLAFPDISEALQDYSNELANTSGVSVVNSHGDLAGLGLKIRDNGNCRYLDIPLGTNLIFGETFPWSNGEWHIHINLTGAEDILENNTKDSPASCITILGNDCMLYAPYIDGEQFPPLGYIPLPDNPYVTHGWVFGRMPLLFNFPNARAVRLGDGGVEENYYGNILAPMAKVTVGESVLVANMDGDVIAKSIEIRKLREGHAWGARMGYRPIPTRTPAAPATPTPTPRAGRTAYSCAHRRRDRPDACVQTAENGRQHADRPAYGAACAERGVFRGPYHAKEGMSRGGAPAFRRTVRNGPAMAAAPEVNARGACGA